MLNDRDGLALYRLLEFPNESAQSWPITQNAGDDGKEDRRRATRPGSAE